ncbi:MAG: dihydroorotase [Candidatus Odinarchaeia archaeon]
MSSEICIKKGKVYTSDGLIECGLNIDNGVITKIAKEPNLKPGEITINAKNKLILPGLIDIHVHLRDLNQSYKETFITGTKAAAKGGVTSVIDMPNTIPKTNSITRFKEKIKKARKNIAVNTGFYSALPDELNEINNLINQGVFGFKIYLNNPDTGYDLLNSNILSKIIRKIAESGSKCLFHAEILDYSKSYKGESDVDAFLHIHNITAEFNAVKHILKAAEGIKASIHICHITTSKTLEFIKKSNTVSNFTTEVTPHHLFLDKSVFKTMGSIAKTVPPLRSKEIVENLKTNVFIKNKVDVIATDHAPHGNEEKEQSFSKAPAGIPGLETISPLLITSFLNNNLKLSRMVELTSTNPARIMNIKNRGVIKEGFFADLIIVDLKTEYKIKGENFISKAKYTPFEGIKVKGKVDKTIVNGKIVYDSENGFLKEDAGVLLKPTKNPTTILKT